MNTQKPPVKRECYVGEFVAAMLPGIIAGREYMNAAFITCREMGYMKNGPVDTGKKGLNVALAKGAMTETNITSFGIYAWVNGGQQVCATYLMANEKDAVSKMAKAKAKIPDVAKNDLLVIYLSYGGFDEALKTVAEIRESAPKMYIVAVTCNCDLSIKEAKAGPFIKANVIDTLVITDGCGGYGAMTDILDALIEQWPGEKVNPA